MRILVTGGAGYIGSVAATILLEAGHKVVVLDNLSAGYEDNLPEGIERFIVGDVADFSKLVTADAKIDAVVHLAAFIAAGESMTKPEIYWENNVVSTIKMLGAMRDLNIKKLIFASSAGVYGNPEKTPITEDAACRPTNTYGMTKLAMDMVITSECFAHGLAAMSFRFFNAAGALPPRGERHEPETHIIPLALRAAANNSEFTLFGTDYPTPDGTCIRDYVHIADLGQAIVLGLENLQPSKHDVYNLGNGGGFSNKQIVDTVQKVTGKKLKVVYGPRREGDPAVLIASSEKARTELGWKPAKSSLEDIIGDAWQFMQSQLK